MEDFEVTNPETCGKLHVVDNNGGFTTILMVV